MKTTIKRIDINVMKRLMLTLYNSMDGGEKRTNLARNANINYDTCVQYLNFLEFIDFAKKITGTKYEKYDLTQNGTRFAKKILNVTK